jgi:hypothetical protein
MRSVGFDRDEPPRGERDCGGRLRPSPDWAFRGQAVAVQVLRQGLMPAEGETATRLDAKRESPQRKRRGRPESVSRSR